MKIEVIFAEESKAITVLHDRVQPGHHFNQLMVDKVSDAAYELAGTRKLEFHRAAHSRVTG